MATRPAAEIDLHEDLVRQLLSAQHPELQDLPLKLASRGWDNTNYRLGTDHMVRLPHRAVADQLIINEQRWLPKIATLVDLPIPAPTHHGTPTKRYPWHWSVVPWFDGDEAANARLADPAVTAAQFGTFFAQLHQPAPHNSPENVYRGCPLENRAKSFATNLAAIDERFDPVPIQAVFEAAMAVTKSTEHVWLHGDLHARNLIVHDGHLAAAIDWGDICAGDPTTDLAAAFMLVPEHLDVVREHANATDQDWQRARGWAINFAVIYLANSDDDAVMGGIGSRLLQAALSL